MSAPALALRPPCGRPGSPSRPRHRCISGVGGGLSLPEGSRSGRLAGRERYSSHTWGASSPWYPAPPGLPHACGGVARRFKAREKGRSSMLRGGRCCFRRRGISVFSRCYLRGTVARGKVSALPYRVILPNKSRSSVSPLKKVKREAAAQPARPRVSGKTALFPRNDRPYGLKCEAFQTKNTLWILSLFFWFWVWPPAFCGLCIIRVGLSGCC